MRIVQLQRDVCFASENDHQYKLHYDRKAPENPRQSFLASASVAHLKDTVAQHLLIIMLQPLYALCSNLWFLVKVTGSPC